MKTARAMLGLFFYSQSKGRCIHLTEAKMQQEMVFVTI